MPYRHSFRSAHRSKQGLTLIELMIAVAIVGILSAIALPVFTGYLHKSKVTEAHGFLADIARAQEAYRAEYYQYCDASGGAVWWPTATPNSGSHEWTASGRPAGWTALGASPPGNQVRFSYMAIAGGLGTTPAAVLGDDLGFDGTDFWYVARAVGDLDADGEQVIFEAYSHRSGIWSSQPKGWE